MAACKQTWGWSRSWDPTSGSQTAGRERERLSLAQALETSKPAPQWHPSSEKNKPTPVRPHLLEPLGAFLSQATTKTSQTPETQWKQHLDKLWHKAVLADPCLPARRWVAVWFAHPQPPKQLSFRAGAIFTFSLLNQGPIQTHCLLGKYLLDV